MKAKKAIANRGMAAVKRVATQPIGYLRGLRYGLRGAYFVYIKHPLLIRYWIIPVLLTMLFIGIAWWLSFSYSDDILASLWTEPDAQSWLGTLGRYVHHAARWLLAAVLGALAVFLAALVSALFAAPFNDLLSEKVEALYAGTSAPPFTLQRFMRDFTRTISIETLKLSIWLCGMLVFFAISFVPLVGAVISAIGGFLLATIFPALDYIDWPASRRDRSIATRIELYRNNFHDDVGIWHRRVALALRATLKPFFHASGGGGRHTLVFGYGKAVFSKLLALDRDL